jgi:hypothetical protein
MKMSFTYIEPGSSSYLVQMIKAGVLAGPFYFKNLWWKIKSLFIINKKEDTTENE